MNIIFINSDEYWWMGEALFYSTNQYLSIRWLSILIKGIDYKPMIKRIGVWGFNYSNYWLVVGPPLWKIWKSIGMISNPIYGKKKMFQTTNQIVTSNLWRLWEQYWWFNQFFLAPTRIPEPFGLQVRHDAWAGWQVQRWRCLENATKNTIQTTRRVKAT